MRVLSIYKSPRRDEMYLYVDKKQGLKSVPQELLEHFGTPVHVMDMPLRLNRKLARVSAEDVLAGIDEKGFYLQMPPPGEDYMQEMRLLAEQAWARRRRD